MIHINLKSYTVGLNGALKFKNGLMKLEQKTQNIKKSNKIKENFLGGDRKPK